MDLLGSCLHSSYDTPPVEEMTPTTSQWQLRRREAGWEGSRRRNRDPRNTWRIGAWMALVSCAYKAGRSGRAGRLRRSPLSSRGRHVDAVVCEEGCWRLSGEVSTGVLGCLVTLGVFAGWDGTVASERALLAVEKSAEVVVPAGSMVAGKG